MKTIILISLLISFTGCAELKRALNDPKNFSLGAWVTNTSSYNNGEGKKVYTVECKTKSTCHYRAQELCPTKRYKVTADNVRLNLYTISFICSK